ncbi:MAG: hypothetical protein Q9227_006612 [Pyrenula ochraceoflavens]
MKSYSITLFTSLLALSGTSLGRPNRAAARDTNEANHGALVRAIPCHNGVAALESMACQEICGGGAMPTGSHSAGLPKRSEAPGGVPGGVPSGVPGGQPGGQPGGLPGAAPVSPPKGTCKPAGFNHQEPIVTYGRPAFTKGPDNHITWTTPLSTITPGPYFTCGGCPAPTTPATHTVEAMALGVEQMASHVPKLR